MRKVESLYYICLITLRNNDHLINFKVLNDDISRDLIVTLKDQYHLSANGKIKCSYVYDRIGISTYIVAKHRHRKYVSKITRERGNYLNLIAKSGKSDYIPGYKAIYADIIYEVATDTLYRVDESIYSDTKIYVRVEDFIGGEYNDIFEKAKHSAYGGKMLMVQEKINKLIPGLTKWAEANNCISRTIIVPMRSVKKMF